MSERGLWEEAEVEEMGHQSVELRAAAWLESLELGSWEVEVEEMEYRLVKLRAAAWLESLELGPWEEEVMDQGLGQEPEQWLEQGLGQEPEQWLEQGREGRDLARTARSGTWMIDQHLAPVGRAGKIGGHLLRPSKRRKLLLSQIRVTSTDIDRNDFRQQLELGREESRKDVSHKCLEFGGLRVRIDRLYTLATPPDLDVVRALMTSDQSCHPGPGLSLDYEQSIQMYLARPNLEGGPLDSESELIAVMRNVSIRLTLVCYGCATCREDSYWAEVAVELFFRPEVCGMCFKEEFENAILVDSELDASITRINSFGRTGGQLESLVYNDEDGEGVTWFHPIIKGITDDYYPAGGLFNEALKNGGVLQRLEVFVGGAKVPVATLHGNAVAQGSRAGNLWANNVGEAFFWSSVDVDGELIRVQFGFCNRSDIDSTHIPSMRFLKFIRQNMGP
ncbi:hypothetical protein KFL_007890060 [Klebsormidium nitens]|uniref:Uncharacterized protein n=1 Tax=Klebsormidium nitens TaxID=105231 RepID=A0A1Y1ITE5_KLENI|nr:hypothetical protein KFL_007890060 [Klebsormidium nitens]|eukprot:GAQ91458.1 hypothetical protein KFL_007890060 [Klebsormidium nitens]